MQSHRQGLGRGVGGLRQGEAKAGTTKVKAAVGGYGVGWKNIQTWIKVL